MSRPNQKTCLVCAWRANCQKRFNLGDNATLYCPDFSEDLALRKEVAPGGDAEPNDILGKK